MFRHLAQVGGWIMLSKLFVLGGTTNFEMLWLVMILFQMVHGMGEVGWGWGWGGGGA